MTDSLSLFQDDPLLSEPGTTYHYTTHGWTLLSAVIEGAAKQDFLKYMKQLFKDLGMDNTCAEFNDDIIHNRARCLVYVLFSCSIHTVELCLLQSYCSLLTIGFSQMKFIRMYYKHCGK